MTDYIKAHEYQKNVNPSLKTVPIIQKNINDCDYGISFIDFSEIFNINYLSTTPNLLASFIKIEKDNNINFKNINININNDNFANSTSNLFYILQGNCEIYIDNESI